MKRPWEIYLEMMLLAGWVCSLSMKSNDVGVESYTATALKGRMPLVGSGATIREAVENMARQLID